MRQLFCALCAVAVVAITILTGGDTRASDATAPTVAPVAASLAAPAAIDHWAFLSLALSASALAVAFGGTSQRGRVRPAVAAAGAPAQRFLHRLAGPAAAATAATEPANPATTADTAPLEELIETVGARYLADLQSIHGVVEQAWAVEVAAREERIREPARQIEVLEGERDVLAGRVHELERLRADSAAALSAARDDLERRLARLGDPSSGGEGASPSGPPKGSAPGRGGPNGGSRAPRGRRAEGGR